MERRGCVQGGVEATRTAWVTQLPLGAVRRAQLPIGVWAEVTGAWVTEDAGVLAALDDLHVWTQVG